MAPTLVFEHTVTPAADIGAAASRIAGHLLSRGVGDGDVVAIMSRNHPVYIEIVLACNLLGAYCCPVNWHFKEGEAQHILEDSGAKALFVQRAFVAQIGVAFDPARRLCVVLDASVDDATGAIGFDAFAGPPRSQAPAGVQPRGAMPYTSGTSGKPKGVVRRPPAPDRLASVIAARDEVSKLVFGIDAGSRCLMSAPLYHSAPFSYTAFCASVGATLFLEERFDALRTLALIDRERITHLYLVPTMYQRLLGLPQAERDAFDGSSVRFVTSTGSPCAPDIKERMIGWWGPVINEAYASTETGYVTLATSADARAKPGTAGRILPHASVRILDADRRDLPTGSIGLIYAIQKAYPDFTYAHDDAGRAAIGFDGLITLGDMGYLDDDGYLFICDRQSNMVISGGGQHLPGRNRSGDQRTRRGRGLRSLRHSRRRVRRSARGSHRSQARQWSGRATDPATPRTPARRLQDSAAHRFPCRTAARGDRKDLPATSARPVLGRRRTCDLSTINQKRSSMCYPTSSRG